MKRAVIAGIAAGAVAVGTGLIVIDPSPPSLPDVEVPAISLSNAEGMDPNAVWLDLFSQASGNNPAGVGTGAVDVGPASVPVPSEPPMVVIDSQGQAQDFEGILDRVVAKMGNPLDNVTSVINGPGAVTYLIRGDGNGGS